VYSQTVKEHFTNPRNVGELEKPDGVGKAMNEADGDQVQLHLQIENDTITDVKMLVMGCVAAIASTSMLTEMIKDRKTGAALAITKQELADALGGLPEHKMRCSLTCLDALHEALGESTKKES
jgi:nitrogen fixation NifU-like protein